MCSTRQSPSGRKFLEKTVFAGAAIGTGETAHALSSGSSVITDSSSGAGATGSPKIGAIPAPPFWAFTISINPGQL
jgi:hypothetical protein